MSVRDRYLTAAVGISLLFAATGAAAPASLASDRSQAATARYLNAVSGQPTRLRRFLEAMPKGADLHNHLSGAVPTETLIATAVSDGLCIDTTTLTAVSAPPLGGACPAGQRPAADSSTDRAFFTQILQAWSMEGFVPGAESGHDHHFATFGKFGAATSHKGDMLATVAHINARQHVHYLETLLSRQGDAVRALATKVASTRTSQRCTRSCWPAACRRSSPRRPATPTPTSPASTSCCTAARRRRTPHAGWRCASTIRSVARRSRRSSSRTCCWASSCSEVTRATSG